MRPSPMQLMSTAKKDPAQLLNDDIKSQQVSLIHSIDQSFTTKSNGTAGDCYEIQVA
jgi:hypothetical protein